MVQDDKVVAKRLRHGRPPLAVATGTALGVRAPVRRAHPAQVAARTHAAAAGRLHHCFLETPGQIVRQTEAVLKAKVGRRGSRLLAGDREWHGLPWVGALFRPTSRWRDLRELLPDGTDRGRFGWSRFDTTARGGRDERVPLAGIVQVDDAYWGGQRRGQRGRPAPQAAHEPRQGLPQGRPARVGRTPPPTGHQGAIRRLGLLPGCRRGRLRARRDCHGRGPGQLRGTPPPVNGIRFAVKTVEVTKEV